MDREIETFIKHFVQELDENNAAIFAGAGLSASAGYVNWKELLRPLSEELGVDIDAEHDFVSLAQYHYNDNGRHGINQQLLREIASSKRPSDNHRILARLPISTYWTTNYDKLIEVALEDSGKIGDVKYTGNHLAMTKPNRHAIVYKMHGDIDHPDTAVITKDDYEKYAIDHALYVNALAGDLISKTFLFLGFSFTDPNLDYVMSRIRISLHDNQRPHFCIFRRCAVDDFEDEETFNQATIKQQLAIKDLKRFQVKTLLVDSYAEITDILKKIERAYKRKTVFISGSAHDFSPWNREDVEDFLCKLGSILIDQEYRLSSGIGLGIGNAVITGAITEVYKRHNRKIEDHITMRPFPQFIEDPDERMSTWKAYRHEIIGHAGIALFFMGNKNTEGGVVLADGVKEEFDIAYELGLAVIPIGVSGYMAKNLWDDVMGHLEKYYPNASDEFIEKLKELGAPIDRPDQLISKIMDTINLISKE